MFPLSNNQPISPSNQTIPFFNEDSSYFFHFPSPIFSHYENDMETVFLQQLDDPLIYEQQPLDGPVAETEFNVQEYERETHQDLNKENTELPIEKQILKKKFTKRGRNSKIDTAQGPRDRRMRMSLQVARKFFALQDMLGFDKASKTVEWLLRQAKDEIKKLASSLSVATIASSSSDCEVVSGIDENTANGIRVQEKGGNLKEKKTSLKKVRKKKVRQPRKNAFQPLGKESREKARERARERTLAKMRNRGHNEVRIFDEFKTQLGSTSSAFEADGEELRAQSHTMNPSFEELLAEVEEAPRSQAQHNELLTNEDRTDDFMMVMGSSSSALNNLQNAGISQEHLFTELQFSGNPWEVYNNHNIC